MTFDGGQALFFPDQRVEIANTLFNCHFYHPSKFGAGDFGPT
jgi:hypothetical protein